jgi:hypothetical protein
MGGRVSLSALVKLDGVGLATDLLPVSLTLSVVVDPPHSRPDRALKFSFDGCSRTVCPRLDEQPLVLCVYGPKVVGSRESHKFPVRDHHLAAHPPGGYLLMGNVIIQAPDADTQLTRRTPAVIQHACLVVGLDRVCIYLEGDGPAGGCRACLEYLQRRGELDLLGRHHATT